MECISSMPRVPDFDWSVDDDPVFAQPEPPPPPPAPRGPAWWRRALRWQTAIIVVVAIALVALGLWLERWWRHQRLVDAIQANVTAVDQARLAGDLERLEQLRVGYWPSEIDLAPQALGQRVTTLQPDLLAFPEPGRVITVTAISPGQVLATIARRFASPPLVGGPAETVWLETLQFQQAEDGDWRQAKPPRATPAESQDHASRFVDWQYLAEDEAYVLAFAPQIDGILAAACERAACPAGTRIRISLTDPSNQAAPRFILGMALFDVLQSGRVTAGFVRLSRPSARGLPGDAAALVAERQSLGLHALAALMFDRWPDAPGSNTPRTAVWIALWVRLADQLALEPQRPGEWVLPDPADTLSTPWAATTLGQTGPADAVHTQIRVNRLTGKLGSRAEALLIQALPTSEDPVHWLADALGSDLDQARTRWEALGEPLSLPLSETAFGDYAVTCGDGLYLASIGDRAARSLLVGARAAPSWGAAWSPDGQRLATSTGVVFDLGRHQAYSIPSYGLFQSSPTWLPDGRLAFSTPPEWAGTPRGGLSVFDPRTLAVTDLSDSSLYALSPSPDSRWLAVNGWPGEQERTWVGLLPSEAEGAIPLWLAPGDGPTWSPDGRWLMFFDYDRGALPLLHLMAIAPAGPAGPGLMIDVADAFRQEGAGWVDSFAFGPAGDSVTFRYTAYDSGSVRQFGARLTLPDGQLSFRRWPDDQLTQLTVIPGAGLYEWRPDTQTIVLRDAFDGLPERVIASEAKLIFSPVWPTLDTTTGAVYFFEPFASYVWRSPTDPASTLELLDLPCAYPLPRPP